MTDQDWIERAIELAHLAEIKGEVPVGALLVKDEECVAQGWNCPIQTQDPTAHAEIRALREAGIRLNNYRLIDTTLYVTLEPCAMCISALIHARVKRLVFGAYDEKRGAVCSAINLTEAEFFNHKIEWTGGILEERCSMQLKDFFKRRRLMRPI